MTFVANGQAPMAEQPGWPALDLPAVTAQSLAGLNAAPGDARHDPASAQPDQMKTRGWKTALNALALHYGDRITLN